MVAVSLKIDENVVVYHEGHQANVDEAQLCRIKRHIERSAGGYPHPAERSAAWNFLCSV